MQTYKAITQRLIQRNGFYNFSNGIDKKKKLLASL